MNWMEPINNIKNNELQWMEPIDNIKNNELQL